MNTSPVHLEIKKGAIPKHHKSFPVPKVHEMALKKELQRLCKLGVLRKCSDSTWASPAFIILKKNGTGSCGKSVIFPHLVGFHSSRQNIY